MTTRFLLTVSSIYVCGLTDGEAIGFLNSFEERMLLCPLSIPCYICNNPSRNEHKQTMSKAPRSGVLAREPGKGFSAAQKKISQADFCPNSQWRELRWTGNKYPWFSTLVLLWRRHREESLNYVRSTEHCHEPLTDQTSAWSNLGNNLVFSVCASTLFSASFTAGSDVCL